MNWDLEERAEDSMVAYLESVRVGEYRVSSAWSFLTNTYPAVVVHVGESEPITEDASWVDARNYSMDIAIVSEAAPTKDRSGHVVQGVRARNAVVRSEVLDAVAKADLLALLNTQAEAIGGVAFSMAQLVTVARTTEERRLITTAKLLVILEPVTGSDL